MCELLIRNVDNINVSASIEKQKRGLYKRGDIVVVLPDGHEYGSKETLPNFVILQFPGVSVDFMRVYSKLEPGRGQRIQEQIPEAEIGDVPGFLRIDSADIFDFETTGFAVQGFIPVDVYLLEMLTRRLFSINIDDLSIQIQSDLSSAGISSVLFNNIKSHIVNKTSLQTEVLRANP